VIQPIERMRANRRTPLLLLLLLLLLIGGCSASVLIATGSRAPEASVPLITVTPSDPTQATSATFHYSDSSLRAGFQCSLDNAPFAPCPAGGVTYNELAVGTHQFRVQATLGRSTSEPATFGWTIVSTSSYQPVRIPAPAVSLPAGGESSSVSGSSPETPVTTLPANNSIGTSTPTTTPATGSTTSPTTASPSGAGLSPSVSGTLTALLYPGVSRALDLVFTNPNSVPVTVAANGVHISISTSQAGCPAQSNFSVNRGLTTSVIIPPNSTESLAQLGISGSHWPVIGMVDTHSNQDACEGASLTLTYSVRVSG
jgi:hypothetical protein